MRTPDAVETKEILSILNLCKNEAAILHYLLGLRESGTPTASELTLPYWGVSIWG